MTSTIVTLAVQVDPADAHLLNEYRWKSHRYGDGLFYVSAWSGGKTVYLHRLITGVKRGEIVDHINGDGLDNRRVNLRIVSHRINLANQRTQLGRSSRFKGVSFNKRGQQWEAYIKVNGKQRRLGWYENELNAAMAYNAAATEAWGEFARLNELGDK